MSQDLPGKVVIVTGAASGIGRATAQRCAAHGAKVVVADVNQSQGEEVAANIGAAAAFFKTDVSKPEEVQALIDFAVSHFGGLNVIFNNAGVGGKIHADFLEDDLADFPRVLSTNLMGTVYGSQFAARYMAMHGGGVIINNASVAGIMPGPTLLSYRASKAAIISFTKSTAIAFAPYNIRVNVLAPGSLQTAITNFGDPSWSAEDTARLRLETDAILTAYQPLKRQGKPEDAAEAVVFLASDRAAQISGIVLPVDGAITAGDPENRAVQLLGAVARMRQEIADRAK